MFENNKIKFVLGSASPRRLDLLKQINVIPDHVYKPDIDEKPYAKELPILYVKRMAKEKMNVVKNKFPNDLILTADTVVYAGRRIIDKTEEEDEAYKFLMFLSGRRHRVTTAFNLYCKDKLDSLRVVTSIVKIKRLTQQEIVSYVKSNEWKGKAGGYGIQDWSKVFIKKIDGCFYNVVGFPLPKFYKLFNNQFNFINK